MIERPMDSAASSVFVLLALSLLAIASGSLAVADGDDPKAPPFQAY